MMYSILAGLICTTSS